MKQLLLFLICASIAGTASAQQRQEAEELVQEGIAYHDKGDYAGAIERYDKALQLDKDNLFALVEKAYSLFLQHKPEQAINCCKKAIEKHPGEKELVTAYITYGNALDELKKTDQALDIYDEGIKNFPDHYQLYFNKGVTLSSVRKYDEAILSFEQAVVLQPGHASSHNGLARLLRAQDKRIPAILAYSRFLIVEPQSDRAQTNLEGIMTLMSSNVEKTGDNSIKINFDAGMLDDTTAEGKPKENNFVSAELALSMEIAMDYDKKNEKKPKVKQFIRKFETLCSALATAPKENPGFYWEYYAPYFVEMHEKKLVETFAYIAFATSGYDDVAKWLKENQSALDKFYTWSNSYNWQ